jgi:hypothetical protein
VRVQQKVKGRDTASMPSIGRLKNRALGHQCQGTTAPTFHFSLLHGPSPPATSHLFINNNNNCSPPSPNPYSHPHWDYRPSCLRSLPRASTWGTFRVLVCFLPLTPAASIRRTAMALPSPAALVSPVLDRRSAFPRWSFHCRPRDAILSELLTGPVL